MKNWRKKLKFNTDSYIKKFKKVHGNLYDYSKFKYKGACKKHIIICKTHGAFKQTAINHRLGNGCLKCFLERNKSTQKQFVEKSKKVHKNKYDYSKSNYTGYKNYVIIKCPIHGFFKQRAGIHLKGSGCEKCRRDKYRLSTKEFIKRSIKLHNNIYDYSKTKYIANNKKVIIICKIHGIFFQTPNKHLKGRGCDHCGGSYLKTKKDFLNKAAQIHGKRYSYKKTKYIRAHKKVVIICKKHGEFSQTPASHLYGKGCPSCCSSFGESLIAKWLVQKGIKFKRQKKFKKCKDKRKLSFDFYLIGRKVCIEYNGRQHYQLINFFGKKTYENYKKHDLLKRNFCKKNKIKLIVIKYSENTIKKLQKEIA